MVIEKVKLNKGEYVFCSVNNLKNIEISNVIGSFREIEGYSIIISKDEIK
mgnify:FL=1